MKLDVVTLDNMAAGSIELSDSIFAAPVRTDLMFRTVNWQLAGRRAGTHKVKERPDVSGTTKKMYKQKGTGGARHGSRRGAQFVGGGIIFGPVVRSHAHDLPKKVRRAALKSALSAKCAEGKLVVLDAASVGEAKTRPMAKRLAKLGWSSVLVIDGAEIDANFRRATANLPGVDLLPSQGANVYDILRRDTLVLTRAGVEALEARLK